LYMTGVIGPPASTPTPTVVEVTETPYAPTETLTPTQTQTPSPTETPLRPTYTPWPTRTPKP